MELFFVVVILLLRVLLALMEEDMVCLVAVRLLLLTMLDFLVELVTFFVLVTGPVVLVTVLVMVLVTPPCVMVSVVVFLEVLGLPTVEVTMETRFLVWEVMAVVGLVFIADFVISVRL